MPAVRTIDHAQVRTRIIPLVIFDFIDETPTSLWRSQRRQGPYQGCLTGTVESEETADRTCAYTEAHLFEDLSAAKPFTGFIENNSHLSKASYTTKPSSASPYLA